MTLSVVEADIIEITFNIYSWLWIEHRSTFTRHSPTVSLQSGCDRVVAVPRLNNRPGELWAALFGEGKKHHVDYKVALQWSGIAESDVKFQVHTLHILQIWPSTNIFCSQTWKVSTGKMPKPGPNLRLIEIFFQSASKCWRTTVWVKCRIKTFCGKKLIFSLSAP